MMDVDSESEDALSFVIDRFLYLFMCINMVIGSCIATYLSMIFLLIPFYDLLILSQVITEYEVELQLSFSSNIWFYLYHLLSYSFWAYVVRCWNMRDTETDDDVDFAVYIGGDILYLFFSYHFISSTFNSTVFVSFWVLGNIRGYWEVFKYQDKLMPISGAFFMPFLYFLQAVLIDVVALQDFPYSDGEEED